MPLELQTELFNLSIVFKGPQRFKGNRAALEPCPSLLFALQLWMLLLSPVYSHSPNSYIIIVHLLNNLPCPLIKMQIYFFQFARIIVLLKLVLLSTSSSIDTIMKSNADSNPLPFQVFYRKCPNGPFPNTTELYSLFYT